MKKSIFKYTYNCFNCECNQVQQTNPDPAICTHAYTTIEHTYIHTNMHIPKESTLCMSSKSTIKTSKNTMSIRKLSRCQLCPS